MGLVREAHLQRILDESLDSHDLCVSVQVWSYKEEAALAAAKRFFVCYVLKFLDVEEVALETKSCHHLK